MLKKLKRLGVTLILVGMATTALLFVSVLPTQTGDATALRLLNGLASRVVEPMPEKKMRDKYSEAGPEITDHYASA